MQLSTSSLGLGLQTPGGIPHQDRRSRAMSRRAGGRRMSRGRRRGDRRVEIGRDGERQSEATPAEFGASSAYQLTADHRLVKQCLDQIDAIQNDITDLHTTVGRPSATKRLPSSASVVYRRIGVWAAREMVRSCALGATFPAAGHATWIGICSGRHQSACRAQRRVTQAQSPQRFAWAAVRTKRLRRPFSEVRPEAWACSRAG